MDPLPDPFLFALFEGLPRKGPGSAASTERAYRCIGDHLHRPQILDIGCGAGASARELARLSRGEVVAVDIHLPFLQEMRDGAIGKGPGRQITPIQATMDRLPFREGTFDVVWSEGAISVMGFPQGLRSWRPLLRDGGFFAVTELAWLVDDPPGEARGFFAEGYPAMVTDAANRRMIQKEGYRLLEAFPLPESAWREEYYAPLGERVREIRSRGGLSPGQEEILAFTEREMEMYERYSSSYGYVMYVMEETGRALHR
ncbi:MAG: class I SAM-dependent methyltransferase [Methanomicrobiales archaeon]|nr:class I SAM-dependent methyltransferase [Methanomicrobiales archaeon]